METISLAVIEPGQARHPAPEINDFRCRVAFRCYGGMAAQDRPFAGENCPSGYSALAKSLTSFILASDLFSAPFAVTAPANAIPV